MKNADGHEFSEYSPEISFWKFYGNDYLCSNFRDAERNRRLSSLLGQIPDLRALKHPQKNWIHILGWIALRDQSFFNHQDGQFVLSVRTGDILIEQHPWDRDVIVTHVPMIEHVSGWLLNPNYEEAKGLWVPIFNPLILKCALQIRLLEIREQAEKFFETEKASWPEFKEIKEKKDRH